MNSASTNKVGAAIAFPDVCIVQAVQGATAAFRRRGISNDGARQLLAGNIVIDPADRLKDARMMRPGKSLVIEDENAETDRTRQARTETGNNNETIVDAHRACALRGVGLSGHGA